MKKITLSLFAFAAAALLLTSCSQLANMTIAKRHFNGGYYVDMGNAKHRTEPAVQKTKEPVTETASAGSTAGADKTGETVKAPVTTAAVTAPQSKKDNSPVLTASAKHEAAGSVKPSLVPNSLKEIKAMKEISKLLDKASKSHDNNHSLLWTIIVILLVLWLISYLMGGWGLGGLLNLLLVIVLILIILALLGVI